MLRVRVSSPAFYKGMMMNMRAKLTVQCVTDYGSSEVVKFSALYSNNPEDNSYSQATPSASMEMCITNPSLKGTIKPGQKFYVDFTKIEE